MSKTVIRFTGSAAPYFAGDIAGFDADHAAKYLKAKVAVPYDPRAAAHPAEAAPATAASVQPEAKTGAAALPPVPDDIGTWSKARIAAWAKEHLGLVLDPEGKREEMVEAVKAEHTKRAEAPAAAEAAGAGAQQK